MRKVTQNIVNAFINRQRATIGNSHTDGQGLYLHGNKIAEFRKDGGLYITAAGWMTNTTKERLNALPGVRIHQKNFEWYLNGQAWGGDWIKVN